MDVQKRHGPQSFHDRRTWFVHFSVHIHGTELSLAHGSAVGVPGELRGWEYLHKKHGKLPWAKLFEGSIKLARDGFTINEDLAAALNNGENWLLTALRNELTCRPQVLTRSYRPILPGRRYTPRMGLFSRREISPIGRSSPRPSNCWSRSFFLPRLVLNLRC